MASDAGSPTPMTLVSELDLPAFDYTDADAARRALPRGDARAARSRAGWRAAPLGYMVLDREAASVLPAHAQRRVPRA